MSDKYLITAPLVGYRYADVIEAAEYLDEISKRNKKRKYYLDDFKYILDEYNETCNIAGLNTQLVVAQCFHETDYIRSWWSQRPRRNPAGIGVTGKKTMFANPLAFEWAYDINEFVFRHGYSFSDWKLSVKAHAGHLLSYIWKDHEMSLDQFELSELSPRKYNIPTQNRGSVKLVKDLNGKWAVPGTHYADGIVRIANEVFR